MLARGELVDREIGGLERRVGAAVGEHRALAARLDDDDAGPRRPLGVDGDLELDAALAQLGERGLAGGVLADAGHQQRPYSGGGEPRGDVRPAAAGAEGIRGRDVTPFLLARFHEQTGGASLRANVRLVLRNAALAGQIAVAAA